MIKLIGPVIVTLVILANTSMAQPMEGVWSHTMEQTLSCRGYSAGGYVENTFWDELPSGSKVKRVRLGLLMARGFPQSSTQFGDPFVVAALNGNPVGGTVTTSKYTACDFSNNRWGYIEPLWVVSEEFPTYYNYNGSNTIRRDVLNGSASDGGVIVEIEYEIGFRLLRISPTNTIKTLTESVLDQEFTVRLVKPSSVEGTVANQPISFNVTPPSSSLSGTSLGTDGEFNDVTTLTVLTDAAGYASVQMKVGEAEGKYLIEATNPDTVTGEVATFEVKAYKPSEIQVWRIDESVIYMGASGLVIPLSPPSLFRALVRAQDEYGLTDSFWFKDVVWSTASPKGSKQVASVTLDPTVGPDSSYASLEPSTFGDISLVASPPPAKYSGLKNATVDLRIKSVILDVSGDFDPVAPNDDMDWWVPGAVTKTSSAPPPPTFGWETPIQKVWLHVPATAPKGTKNLKVRFEIQNPSQHPGIAMNWPPWEQALVDNDLWFEGGKNVLVKDVPIDVDGFTSVQLYVGDYAASATLAVTIDGGATYTVKIPRAQGTGSQMLPEAGWWALQNFEASEHIHINSAQTNPVADSDVIDPPAKVHYTTEGKFENRGRYGDGLSAFQEYRGFVVRGAHRRLNPHWKDLFIVADGEAQQEIWKIRTLPLTLHRVESSEVKMDQDDHRPVINFNHESGGDQRAVLLRILDPGPSVLDTESGEFVDAYTLLWGRTYLDGETYDPLVLATDLNGHPVYPDLASPNGTTVAEVYPRNIVYEIWPGEDGTLQSAANNPCIVDEFAASVPFGCDQFRTSPEGTVYIHGGNKFGKGDHYVMDTVCDPSDECRARPHADCDLPVSYTILARSLWGPSAAHEVGHALNIYHSQSFADGGDAKYCGRIMSYGYQGVERYPKKDFTDFEVEQVRIHENN